VLSATVQRLAPGREIETALLEQAAAGIFPFFSGRGKPSAGTGGPRESAARSARRAPRCGGRAAGFIEVVRLCVESLRGSFRPFKPVAAGAGGCAQSASISVGLLFQLERSFLSAT